MKNYCRSKRKVSIFLAAILFCTGVTGQKVSAMEEIPGETVRMEQQDTIAEPLPEEISDMDESGSETADINVPKETGAGTGKDILDTTTEELSGGCINPEETRKNQAETVPEEVQKNEISDVSGDETQKNEMNNISGEEVQGNAKSSVSGEEVQEDEMSNISGDEAQGDAAEVLPEEELSVTELELTDEETEEPVFTVEIPASLVVNRSFTFSLRMDAAGPVPDGNIVITVNGTVSPDDKAFGLYQGDGCWPYLLVLDEKVLSPQENEVTLPAKAGCVEAEILPVQDPLYAGTYEGKLTFSVSYEEGNY